jgi:hypothetical protein
MLGRHGLLLLVFLAGAFTTVTTMRGVFLNFSPVPYGDQWDSYLNFYAHRRDGWFDFWTQHNEHRIVISKLIFWADFRWFGGRNVLALASNLLLLALLAAALYRLATYERKPEKYERLALAGAICAVMFSWVQAENLTWGFQSQWYAVYLFGTLAFLLLARSREPNHSNIRLCGAIACGFAATCSLASGLLVPPLLVIFGLFLGLRAWKVLPLVLAAAAAWLIYFKGLTPVPTPDGRSSLQTLLHSPLGIARFTLMYLGNPLGTVANSETAAVVAGLLFVSCSLAAAWFGLRQRRAAKAVALLAVIAFICACGFTTAIGRLPYGASMGMSSRYTTATLTGWTALFLFAAANAQTRRVRMTIEVAGALMIASLVIYQPTALKPNLGALFQRNLAGLAVVDDIYDPAFTRPIYPVSRVLKDYSDEARSQGLSIFAVNSPDFAGVPTDVHATEACAGAIDTIDGTGNAGYYVARGWIYAPGSKRIPHRVFIADIAGRVLGQGVVGDARPDAAKALSVKNAALGWGGFFNSTAQSIRVFGELENGRFCIIERTASIPDILFHTVPLHQVMRPPARWDFASARGWLAQPPSSAMAGMANCMWISGTRDDGAPSELELSAVGGTAAAPSEIAFKTGADVGQSVSITLANGSTRAFSLPNTDGAWRTLAIKITSPSPLSRLKATAQGTGVAGQSAIAASADVCQ